MNRNQRKYGRNSAKTVFPDNLAKIKQTFKNDVEEVFPPRHKHHEKQAKPMSNRCCFVSPDSKDFGQQQSVKQVNGHQTQIIDTQDKSSEMHDQYQNLILEQYGFDPLLPDTVNQLRELKKVLCGNSCKVENSSQYVSPLEKKESRSEDSRWQNIDNVDDIDNFIKDDKEKVESGSSLPQNVHICEIPRVKIIAEKYSKIKKNNVELRQLDEKVVCIEYDIYKGNNTAKPKQKLRAFFSVKPTVKSNKDNSKENITILSEKFHMGDQDRKEIEIIDSKIEDNKPYLEDLRRVLKRNQAIYVKKNKTSLDLLSLYEMAKQERPPLDEDFSHTNLLSKAELEEVKQLILKKCTSSVDGISRRKVRPNNDGTDDKKHDSLSNSLVAVLLQE